MEEAENRDRLPRPVRFTQHPGVPLAGESAGESACPTIGRRKRLPHNAQCTNSRLCAGSCGTPLDRLDAVDFSGGRLGSVSAKGSRSVTNGTITATLNGPEAAG
jgi:hypothetical protein